MVLGMSYSLAAVVVGFFNRAICRNGVLVAFFAR
jgi:hypothetical protein